MPGRVNYNQYDYRRVFWTGRDYEHRVETTLIRSILRTLYKQANNPRKIADIGCGFGRLFSTYATYSDEIYMLDYSDDMLAQAKSMIEPQLGNKSVYFKQADVYNLPTDIPPVDLIIMLRVLHHTPDIKTVMTQLYNALDTNGVAIVDIPNQIHLLNRLRFHTGRLSVNLYQDTPMQHGNLFYNYLPQSVIKQASEAGFTLKRRHTHSFLRHNLIKQWVPHRLLACGDWLLQQVAGQRDWGPSVYAVLQKN